MAAWRIVATLVVLLAAARTGWTQTYPLAEPVKEGDCFRLRLDMTLQGEIKVHREGKPESLPLSAKASHEYPERVLVLGSTGLPEKVARIYEAASATVTAAGERSEKTLRKERQLFVAQRHNDQPLTYSPAGPLTREELELTAEHFDTLGLTGLLPDKEVAVGDTWKVPNAVVQALCHFEGLTEQDLTGKLDEVKDNTAHVTVSGSASGIELGAQVKLKVQARYRFDLGSRRLTWLEWKQTDDRDQGPASPAMTAQCTTTITRAPIERPDRLADVALVSVPDGFKVPEQLTYLEYRDPKSRFDLGYARDWQVVGTPGDRVVLRLMDRGDFVAQATVTPWVQAAKGQHTPPDEFKTAMAGTPGWEAEKELQSGEVPAEGRWIYRVSMLGQMDGIKVLQNFYLVAAPSGEQVVVAVTLTPKKADQLGSRDLSLVGSLEFPSDRKDEKPK
jgi:hypothetical protein